MIEEKNEVYQILNKKLILWEKLTPEKQEEDEEKKEGLEQKINEDKEYIIGETIKELIGLELEDLNEKTEENFKKNSYNILDENFQEFKEKLLDVLLNRISKIETFDGINSNSESIRFRNIIRDFEDEVIQMPTFQRKYIWDRKRASELIASLIYGIPIPPIYSYELENNNNIRYIIDGQQRLTTLLFYYYGAFPRSEKKRFSYNKKIFELLKERKSLIEKKDYKEKILKIEEKIKKYDISLDVKFMIKSQDGENYDLSKVNNQVKNTIFNRTIDIVTIMSKNKSAMAHIFNVYNTGGIRLTENEIRKAIFSDNILYKNIIYISNPTEYKNNIEEDNYKYNDFENYNKILSKIIGNKEFESSLFRILSQNFNINYKYENNEYIAEDKLSKILKKMEMTNDAVNILNTKVNYAKGKIASLIDEYSNYISKNSEFSKKEIKSLFCFIKIINRSSKVDNRKQYDIKNITCIYILLRYFNKLDDNNLTLKEEYFKCSEKFNYKTLERERIINMAEILKKDGVINYE